MTFPWYIVQVWCNFERKFGRLSKIWLGNCIQIGQFCFILDTIPGRVRNVVITVFNVSSFTVSWLPPLDNGDSMLSYFISVTPYANQTNQIYWREVVGNITSHNVVSTELGEHNNTPIRVFDFELPSFSHSIAHPLTYLLTHSLTHSLAHSLIHPLTHSLTNCSWVHSIHYHYHCAF